MKKLSIIICFLAAYLGMSAQTEDKTVIVVSDWHLSDYRSMEPGHFYATTVSNVALIVQFINNIIDGKMECDVLVLNGDIFELWRTPADVFMIADESSRILTDAEYLLKIRECNEVVFSALEKLRKSGVDIVYLPGNHDMQISESDLETAFPGLFSTSYDTRATGIYEPFGPGSAVAIEHGNRYEYFNAPYPHGKLGPDNVEEYSVLAPGYFVTKLSATAAVYSQMQAKAKKSLYSYKAGTDETENDSTNRAMVMSFWNAIHAGIGSPFFTVRARTDGVGNEENPECRWEDYAVSMTNNPSLFPYSWTEENWNKRCELNNVPKAVPFADAMLSAVFYDYTTEWAFSQRLSNRELPTLICVFGHTHKASLATRHEDVKGDVIYLNEGQWVDEMNTCTFGVIHYSADMHQYSVELRHFTSDCKNVLDDCRYLYVPDNNVMRSTDGELVFKAKSMLTDGTSDIRNIVSVQDAHTVKRLIDGKIVIMRNGVPYRVTGQKCN